MMLKLTNLFEKMGGGHWAYDHTSITHYSHELRLNQGVWLFIHHHYHHTHTRVRVHIHTYLRHTPQHTRVRQDHAIAHLLAFF